MVGVDIQSASGYLAILDDPDVHLKSYALERLDTLVDRFWPEISDEIIKL
jgi:26S proteasome regulatory subunit N2